MLRVFATVLLFTSAAEQRVSIKDIAPAVLREKERIGCDAKSRVSWVPKNTSRSREEALSSRSEPAFLR